jgi:hypothetical protein
LVLGGCHVPLGQAVSTKACEIHQVNILHIGALLQVCYQPPEGSGFKLGA